MGKTGKTSVMPIFYGKECGSQVAKAQQCTVQQFGLSKRFGGGLGEDLTTNIL